jgi:hypothetical protein
MSAYRNHRRQVEELYADDPFVTPAQYGRFMDEADELDRADAANDELLELWEARAAEEEGEPA